MSNKRVKNATIIQYRDIKFKSKLEATFYEMLLQAGFNPQYESKTYVLWNGFKPTIPFYTKDRKTKDLKLSTDKLRDITYTPDFSFNYNGLEIIIEAKGKENDTYPIKRKLFRKILEKLNPKPLVFEVFNKKQLLSAIEIIKSYEAISTENTEANTTTS